MQYPDYRRNYAIAPGRERALDAFLRQEHNGAAHKWRHRGNSNSEDALTWSCFEALRALPWARKVAALDEMLEDAYQGECALSFARGGFGEGDIEIFAGKRYVGGACGEETEVDASIEAPGKLIFIEAKLYSSVSMSSPLDPKHDQIARKLRVGLDAPLGDAREFYFIFLDIAPHDKLTRGKKSEAEVRAGKGAGFHDKWKSAWLFRHYQSGKTRAANPLARELEGVDAPPPQAVAANMGWLTWGDLFKVILRAVAAAPR
ncbi:MAG: hypothetical protein OD918_05610 [Gammaproteobacteria bacterium]